MLKILSFKIGDADGINAALQQFPLASNMHIMVSNGEIAIPFEDGLPKPKAVEIVELQEENNTLGAQIGVIEHSERVNEFQLADIKERMNEVRAEINKATANPERKRLQARLDDLQANYDGVYNQSLKNKHELARLGRNIEENNEKIAKLSA